MKTLPLDLLLQKINNALISNTLKIPAALFHETNMQTLFRPMLTGTRLKVRSHIQSSQQTPIRGQD